MVATGGRTGSATYTCSYNSSYKINCRGCVYNRDAFRCTRRRSRQAHLLPEETLPRREVGTLEQSVLQDALHTSQRLPSIRKPPRVSSLQPRGLAIQAGMKQRMAISNTSSMNIRSFENTSIMCGETKTKQNETRETHTATTTACKRQKRSCRFFCCRTTRTVLQKPDQQRTTGTRTFLTRHGACHKRCCPPPLIIPPSLPGR